jgi:hypothetical protein
VQPARTIGAEAANRNLSDLNVITYSLSNSNEFLQSSAVTAYPRLNRADIRPAWAVVTHANIVPLLHVKNFPASFTRIVGVVQYKTTIPGRRDWLMQLGVRPNMHRAEVSRRRLGVEPTMLEEP